MRNVDVVVGVDVDMDMDLGVLAAAPTMMYLLRSHCTTLPLPARRQAKFNSPSKPNLQESHMQIT